MKKISIVVMEKYRELSLEKLREIGVVHLETKKKSSDTLTKLLYRKARAEAALRILQSYGKSEKFHTIADDRPDLVSEILDYADELKELKERLKNLCKERSRIEEWGNFDPLDISFLAEKANLNLFLYRLPYEVFERLSKEIRYIALGGNKKSIRLIVFDQALPEKAPFAISEYSLIEIDSLISDVHEKLSELEQRLSILTKNQSHVEKELKIILTEIEFETARAGMDILEDVPWDSTVAWITGFVPQEDLESLKKKAMENGWALLSEDPAPTDRPPTLVRNNAVVRIIQPLFSFLDTIPGYREYDISSSYLIFLCLFFAMIFGDAGYGVLLFILSAVSGLVFTKKHNSGGFAASFPDVSKLFMLLSLCTVAWGSVTGSWFAIPPEFLPAVLRSLIILPFNNSGPLAEFPLFLQKLFRLPAEVPVDELKTQWNIQFLCFTVGAAQLIWARGKNIVKLLPSLTAIAQAGWLIMMVGIYFLVLFILLKVSLPSFTVWLIGVGLALYFIFAEQHGGNIIENIVKSFTNFLSIFLNVVGSFADIISYIRLFAVGLAGGIIAQSFNNMAIPSDELGSFGLGFILQLLAAILILFVGHTINIAMNALSVIVHGVRLNLLEYAGNHLGMEWTGYAYKPFTLK